MVIIGTLTQALLYVCYAMLMGSFILDLVPNKHRPVVHVPKKYYYSPSGDSNIFIYTRFATHLVLKFITWVLRGFTFGFINF